MTAPPVAFFSDSPDTTFEIGRLLGEALAAGDTIALSGDLGAGKTLFCKGVACGLGIDPDDVSSPTFTIVSEHDGGRLPFRHVDAYRLASPEEGVSAGLEDVFAAGCVTAVEWPENVAILLPNACLRVRFLVSGTGRRTLSFEFPDTLRYRQFLEQCKRFLTGG